MTHDDLIGRVIDGRYRVDAEIGEGAMGIVYRCRHVRLEKDLAIKILRREQGQSQDIIRRFVKEARLASSLKHPNVVDLSDCGEMEGGGAYSVMELLEGEALAETLARERRIAPKVAFHIVLQIAAGLKAAHEREIVHRDLKPENVFLSSSSDGLPRVKLLDFGIARAKGSKDTLPGTVLGTPEYMAPEQARGDAVDTRADLYALGVMLFEMLSGRVPLYAEDLGELIRLKLSAVPMRLRQAAPDLVGMVATDAVIAQLLEREPAARLQTVEACERSLREAQAADLNPNAGAELPKYTQGIGSGRVSSPSPNTAYDRAVGGAWQRPGTRLPSVGQQPLNKGHTVPVSSENHAAIVPELVREPRGGAAPALEMPAAAAPQLLDSNPSSAAIRVVQGPPSSGAVRVPWDEGETTRPGSAPLLAAQRPARKRSAAAIPRHSASPKRTGTWASGQSRSVAPPLS
ncbi:MAG: serine/threonine-protein kinase [Myxococcota bacterium]